MTRFVTVITPVLLCGKGDSCEPAVFIRDVQKRKPVLRLAPAAEFSQLARGLTPSCTNALHAAEPPARPLLLPRTGALEILKTGRLPPKLATAPSEFVEPIPLWLACPHRELRQYAAGLAARRPHPSDLSALRSLIVRSGWKNDHAAKLGCYALRKLGPKAAAAIPELLRAASGFASVGCPQRFCHAAPAVLKISPASPPPELIETCIKHLKVSNYGIQKTAIETLIAVAARTSVARDALRRIDKLRNAKVSGKPMEQLLRRAASR